MRPWPGDTCIQCGLEYKQDSEESFSNWVDTEDGWLCTKCVLDSDLQRHGLVGCD